MKKILFVVMFGIVMSCSSEDKDKTPVAVIVRSITVTKYPALDAMGKSWDSFSFPASLPDVQLAIYKGSTQVFKTNYIDNWQAPPLTAANLSVYLDDITSTYQLRLHDDDSPLTPDVMATVDFIPYAGTIKEVIKVSTATFEADIKVEYQY